MRTRADGERKLQNGQAVGGGVAGAIVTAVVALIKNKMA
jgi:hypothetical protein